MTYNRHGHVPSDGEIAKDGYKAFGPARPPFVPTAADFQAAARDMATGGADELRDVAIEVAGYWDKGDDTYATWVVGYWNDGDDFD